MSSIGPVQSNVPIPPPNEPQPAAAPPSQATPAAQNLPATDPSIVVGQHGHGGGAHKGAVHHMQNQQNVIQQQQQAYVFKPQELKEINPYTAEETEPEKDKDEEDTGDQQKKPKQPSMKTKWKRAKNSRLKI